VRTAVKSPPQAAPSSAPENTAHGRNELTALVRSIAPSGVSAYCRSPSLRLRREPVGAKMLIGYGTGGGTGSGNGGLNGSGHNGGSNTSTTAPIIGP